MAGATGRAVAPDGADHLIETLLRPGATEHWLQRKSTGVTLVYSVHCSGRYQFRVDNKMYSVKCSKTVSGVLFKVENVCFTPGIVQYTVLYFTLHRVLYCTVLTPGILHYPIFKSDVLDFNSSSTSHFTKCIF